MSVLTADRSAGSPAESDTLTVQPSGTPGLLLVRNNASCAPGLLEQGMASDCVDFDSEFGQLVDDLVVAQAAAAGPGSAAGAAADQCPPAASRAPVTGP